MPKIWKERFLRVPGARQATDHLLKQGHTNQEAEVGGLAVAFLVIVLVIIIFNGFLWGIVVAFFKGIRDYCDQNPIGGVFVGLLATIVFLGLFFRYLQKSSEKENKKKKLERRDREQIEAKKSSLQRGAMGNFEGVFRHALSEKFPEIAVMSVHVVDTTPRVRFKARIFRTEMGGNVGVNYELFRNNLFKDVLSILETAFSRADNIPYVIVDAMMQFINRKAEYYDGAVLSLKAQKEVFEKIDRAKTQPFKVLTSFDLRYHDGMEVPVLPEEESKTARVIERIKENAPRLNIRYEKIGPKVDDGWEKPKAGDAAVLIQETLKGKELNSLSEAQFQDLVMGLLAKMSYEIKAVKRVPGGILQMMADYHHPVIGGNFMILARQSPESSPLHADLVRQLDVLAREETCKRGVYIATGRFTEEARNISRKMAVDLVDITKLFELLEAPAYDGRWTFRVVDEKGVLNDLNRMPLLSFEKEVDLFLKSTGFKVTKIRRVPGGAVVAVAEHDHPISGGKFAVMARQFPGTERVGAELVSELVHVMAAEFCYRGLLMVTADFAMDARALSRFSNVELVDRNLWENMRRHL